MSPHKPHATEGVNPVLEDTRERGVVVYLGERKRVGREIGSSVIYHHHATKRFVVEYTRLAIAKEYPHRVRSTLSVHKRRRVGGVQELERKGGYIGGERQR